MARGIKGTGPYSKVNKKKFKPTPISSEEAAEIVEAAKTFTANTEKRAANKSRSIEELDHVDPAKMTDNERITYIRSARTAMSMQSKKIEELHKVCESAFTQFKNADNAYRELKAHFDTKTQFIDQTATVFIKTIQQTLAGGNY